MTLPPAGGGNFRAWNSPRTQASASGEPAHGSSAEQERRGDEVKHRQGPYVLPALMNQRKTAMRVRVSASEDEEKPGHEPGGDLRPYESRGARAF